MSETIAPKPNEPTMLSAALTEFIVKHEPGTRMHALGTDLLRAHSINRDRRGAVLKHEDLAKRLVDELGYAKAEQWNGYIPPAFTDPGGQERLCSGAVVGPHGEIRAHYSQIGRYAIGETPNDSPRRAALLDISREAWIRDRRAAVHEPREDL
jgi:hypothetical protein